MIKIIEDTPTKVSGLSSLKISFPFNQQIIDIIKQEPIFSYDKTNSTWELPITSLSSILDKLTYIDDIELKLKNDTIENKPNEVIKTNFKTKPFKYQLEGIEYGLTHDKWLLLDGMGLGKTLQMIYLAEELKLQKHINHCLIICGVNSLKTNWKREIKKHSTLGCRILGETINKNGNISYASIEDRGKELKNKIDEFFIITNIESFRDKKTAKRDKNNDIKRNEKGKILYNCTSPLLDAINVSDNKIDMIVIDEIHKCKDPTSLAGKNILKIKSKYKIALTGTLLLNNPLDTYVPLKWIEKEHSPFYTFKNMYCQFGGFNNQQIIGFKNLDVLKDELSSCSLRRTKDQVLKDLPPKNIIDEYIDLEDEHLKFYNDIKNGVKEEADKINLNTSSLLAMITRLRQATVLPSILTSQNIESSKILRCCELVDNILQENEKVVIMSTFKEPIAVLKEKLIKYNLVVCTGDTKDVDIDKNVNEFQNNPNCKIMLATWQKMGTGFTLTAASYMINLDTAWTYSLFEQTCDRIYRIGQNKPVFIYNIIATNTIDERVRYLLNFKKSISDFVVDDRVDQNGLNYLKDYITDL